jgi:uncharacterized protein (DUF1778 family)
MARTALLIRCEADEADRIRVEAQKERRTISSYVLSIALRAAASERLPSGFNHYRRSSSGLSIASPRRAILVRCAVTEAEQIREAARRHAMPINAFILGVVKDAWNGRPTLPPLGVIEASRNPQANQPSRAKQSF